MNFKNKHKMLPWVQDFKDPQNRIRFEMNVNKLKWDEWFWCHPSAYSLVRFSIPVLGILLFFSVAYILRFSMLLSGIMVLLGITQVFKLKKKVKKYEYEKETTFYDLWMREF